MLCFCVMVCTWAMQELYSHFTSVKSRNITFTEVENLVSWVIHLPIQGKHIQLTEAGVGVPSSSSCTLSILEKLEVALEE